MQPEVTVLRLGHRLVRDTRTSTHVALVARAFGAREIIMSGADEDETFDSIAKVKERWGGDFKISQNPNWRQVIKNFQGVVVHLTMYGEMLDSAVRKIQDQLGKEGKLLVIVGGEKVPREIYSLSHNNVSVGNQPHSEVAALAIFLDRIYKGRELYSHFEMAKMEIRPSVRGKEVIFSK